MKRLAIFMLAAVCILSMTGPCFAAPAEQAGGRSYVYSTAALGAYNYAQFHLSGKGIRIVRRGYQNPLQADTVQVLLNDQSVLSLSAEWEEQPVDGKYYGYTVELDTTEWGDGEFTLTVESSAIECSRDDAGKTTGFRSGYQLASVHFVKRGVECYFPPDTSLSGRYNRNLMVQLQQGEAPDDFAVLKDYYSKQENRHILLDIQATAEALTAGLYSDLEKCLAINEWIAKNIAYDFDFPRDNIDHWLKQHPEEAVRQEDALYAFERRYAMCYGYARLTVLMLGYAGIDSVYVRGYNQNNISATWNSAEISRQYSSSWNARVPPSWFSRASDGTEVPDIYNHAWNAVNISGSWYFLDACKDAMYGYYRIDSGDPGTSYVKLTQCYSGVHVFPALSQISGTHIAIRYGADGYGKRLRDA